VATQLRHVPDPSSVAAHGGIREGRDMCGPERGEPTTAVSPVWGRKADRRVVLRAAALVGGIAAAGGLGPLLERSRTEEVGVANLFLLTGDTAPKDVKRAMTLALVVQVVAAFVGAIIGVTGLEEGDLNALAFGVLVPIFGIGMNGVWAARYGSYGPRVTAAPPKKNG